MPELEFDERKIRNLWDYVDKSLADIDEITSMSFNSYLGEAQSSTEIGKNKGKWLERVAKKIKKQRFQGISKENM